MESLVAMLLVLLVVYLFSLVPKSNRKSKKFGEGLFVQDSGFNQPWDLK